MDRRAFLSVGGAAGLTLSSPYIARGAFPMTLRWAHLAPEDHPAHIAAMQFAAAVERRADGVNVINFLNWIKRSWIPTEWTVVGNGDVNFNVLWMTGGYSWIGIQDTTPRLPDAAVPPVQWFKAISDGVTLGTSDLDVGFEFSTAGSWARIAY